MLLNKIDLLPYLQFDLARYLDYARRVSGHRDPFQYRRAPARHGRVVAWIREGALRAQQEKRESIDSLKRHIVDLEAQVANLRS
jgi:hydrogenase nickel incorporation protein HypB